MPRCRATAASAADGALDPDLLDDARSSSSPAATGIRTTRPPRASTDVAADDAVGGPVGALDEHVRLERAR